MKLQNPTSMNNLLTKLQSLQSITEGGYEDFEGLKKNMELLSDKLEEIIATERNLTSSLNPEMVGGFSIKDGKLRILKPDDMNESEWEKRVIKLTKALSGIIKVRRIKC